MALILQLDSNGQPNTWITLQDAVVYHAKGLVTWSFGDDEMIIKGGNNRMTGQRSIIRTASIIAVKGESGSKRRYRVPGLNNRQLFRRDNNMCAYCGRTFKESLLSRDHIIPSSRGGDDSWMNVVTCCAKCNQNKSDKTLEEAGLQLLYLPYIPSRAEYLLLANRNVLYDQMEFLLSFIPDSSRLKTNLIKDQLNQ